MSAGEQSGGRSSAVAEEGLRLASWKIPIPDRSEDIRRFVCGGSARAAAAL